MEVGQLICSRGFTDILFIHRFSKISRLVLSPLACIVEQLEYDHCY